MGVEDISWNFIEYMKAGRESIAKSRSLRYFLKPILNLQGEECVLDVGCGIGTVVKLLRPLLGTRGKIIGIDIDPALVEYGNLHWARQPNVRLEVGDATQIAYPDAAFDVVISMGLLEFVSDRKQEQVLSEMARVLRPSGSVIVIQVDSVHYLTLPENASFKAFYEGILEGMRQRGVDLELTRFKAICQQRDWIPEGFTFNFEYHTQITERFVHLLEEQDRTSYFENTEYLEQAHKFNFQFLQGVGWTKRQLWEYLNSQLESQIAFFREHIGEEYYQKTPICVFRVHF